MSIRVMLGLALGRPWPPEHTALASELGKPMFLGEFGLRNLDGFPLDERRAIYRRAEPGRAEAKGALLCSSNGAPTPDG